MRTTSVTFTPVTSSVDFTSLTGHSPVCSMCVVPATAKEAVKQHRQQYRSSCQGIKHRNHIQNVSDSHMQHTEAL
ncbi:MAG: hypothetical protein JNM43_14975 [Planctomycetaceae bacterium]|nr:hypothetical protein [Planctomycetaceae bacterium]